MANKTKQKRTFCPSSKHVLTPIFLDSEVRNFCGKLYVVRKCKASKIELHQSTAASTWWCGPRPVWVGSKWLLAFPRVPVTLGTPITQTIFSPCSPLNDRRKVARSLFKIGLSSLYSYLSLARLFILLLLLMIGNVHPNPCPVFSYLVFAGNVTWWGRSVQCCTCFN